MKRVHLLLGGAAAACVLASVGLAVSQEDQPQDARPAPAATPVQTTPAPSAVAPVGAPNEEEAPPPAAAAAPADPAAAAVEDRLTAVAEAEASARPAEAPRRRRAAVEDAEETADPAAGSTNAPVLPRQRLAVAVMQGLDKSTARTVRFYAPVGRSVRYEGLVVTARSCETTNPQESRQDSWVYLDVFSQPRPVAGRPATQPRRVYRGWMSAEAPTVHPFGHPAYDVWLIECRASAPVSTGGA